jgi:hypothetical protein
VQSQDRRQLFEIDDQMQRGTDLVGCLFFGTDCGVDVWIDIAPARKAAGGDLEVSTARVAGMAEAASANLFAHARGQLDLGSSPEQSCTPRIAQEHCRNFGRVGKQVIELSTDRRQCPARPGTLHQF